MSSQRSEHSPPYRGHAPKGGADADFAAGPDGEIHIWSFSLELDDACAEAVLSVWEAARAARFRFVHDRRRFVNGRASLRFILGSYLDKPAAELLFSYGPTGKPALAGPHGQEGLTFNLSHSEDRALLAVARRSRLGVDLERVQAFPDLNAVAARFFAAEEVRMLAKIDPSLRTQAFFAIWTRKEALLKAFGAGLSLPLDEFCVSTDPLQPARIMSSTCSQLEPGRWSLADVDPGDGTVGFRAALAIEGAMLKRRFFRWDPLLKLSRPYREASSSTGC